LAGNRRDLISALYSQDARINRPRAQDFRGKVLYGAFLVKWTLVYTKQAQKDAKKIAAAGLRPKAEELLEILEENPFKTPPHFEKLVGDLTGAFSRRINIQHRLVYQVLEDRHIVKVIRMWTHYE
jgi:toxin YoeB